MVLWWYPFFMWSCCQSFELRNGSGPPRIAANGSLASREGMGRELGISHRFHRFAKSLVVQITFHHSSPRSCAVFGVRKPLAFSRTSASQFWLAVSCWWFSRLTKELETNGTNGQTDNLMQAGLALRTASCAAVPIARLLRDLKHLQNIIRNNFGRFGQWVSPHVSLVSPLDLGGFSGHGAGQWWAGGERGHGASPGGSGADVVGIVAEGRGKIMENLLECGQPNAINIHKPTIGDGWYNPWWFWWFMDVYGIGFTMVYHIEIWCMQGAWPSMHGTALFASVARMNHSCCSSASDCLMTDHPIHQP